MNRLFVFEPKTSLSRKRPGEAAMKHYRLKYSGRIPAPINTKAGLYAAIREITGREQTMLIIDLSIDAEVLAVLTRVLGHRRKKEVIVISLRPMPVPLEIPARAQTRTIVGIEQLNSAIATLNELLQTLEHESRPTPATLAA
jgi:hypothetical protein